MDDKTLIALKASITRAEKNVTAKGWCEVDLSWQSCPLCDLFYMDGCEGCPVAGKTRRTGCAGSPYDAMKDNLLDWIEGDGGKEGFMESAEDFLAFLKDLLPKGETTPAAP